MVFVTGIVSSCCESDARVMIVTNTMERESSVPIMTAGQCEFDRHIDILSSCEFDRDIGEC